MLTRVAILLLSLVLCSNALSEDALRLRHFPTENDIVPTDRARKLLRRARIDFDLVRRQQRPRYAKFKYMLYDGGTTVYEARGYIITKAHRIAGFRRGKAYYETGTAIDVTAPISNRALSYGGDTHGQ